MSQEIGIVPSLTFFCTDARVQFSDVVAGGRGFDERYGRHRSRTGNVSPISVLLTEGGVEPGVNVGKKGSLCIA